MPTKIAVFPGSFDPFTSGHKNIVDRSLQLVDHVIIAIGVNDKKISFFDLDDRINMIKEIFIDNNNVSVMSYDGLTVDFVKSQDANIIVRGIRSVSDFEYERNIADINQMLGIDTIVLFADSKFISVSSSIVRELIRFKKDIFYFLPAELKNSNIIKQYIQ